MSFKIELSVWSQPKHSACRSLSRAQIFMVLYVGGMQQNQQVLIADSEHFLVLVLLGFFCLLACF
jgi:hypothetical protein